MENTDVRLNDGVDRPDDYLGGIDLHGAVNWTIRNNVARNIIGQGGGRCRRVPLERIRQLHAKAISSSA